MSEPSWTFYCWTLRDQIALAAHVAIFLYSLWRGAAPERLLAGMLCAMPVIDPIYHLLVGGSFVWLQAEVGHLVIDMAVMAGVFVVALHANRVYPLWIGGAQIIAITGHIYRLSLTQIDRFAYDVMTVTPSYIQLIVMVAGIACHTSRRRRLGDYPSWRRPSPVAQDRAETTAPGG